MKWLLFALAALVVTSMHGRARACSPRRESSTLAMNFPVPGPIAGPLPLLMSQAEPVLTDGDGNPVPMVRDTALAEIEVGLFPALSGRRPATPLAEGEYQWGEVLFEVDPALAPKALPVLSEASFNVVIDRPEEESGCSEFPCGRPGMTRIEVVFRSAKPSRTLILIEVTNRDRNDRAVFFGRANPSDLHDVDLWSGYEGNPDRDTLCVALTPYAEDGAAGARIELGCSDPKTGENFNNLDDEGCASTQSTNAYALLFAGLVLALRRPRRVA